VSRHFKIPLKPKMVFALSFFFLLSCTSFSTANSKICRKINSAKKELQAKAPYTRNGEPDLNSCTETPIDTSFIECFTKDVAEFKNDGCVYAKIAKTEKKLAEKLKSELEKYKKINNLQILAFNDKFPDSRINYETSINTYKIKIDLKDSLDEILCGVGKKYSNEEELMLFALLYTNKDRKLQKLEDLIKDNSKNSITIWFNLKNLDILLANLEKSKACVWDRLILLQIIEKHYYFECRP
jgi:hypothetical protein